jgi:tetratricopeptide (TPR) repeat protein
MTMIVAVIVLIYSNTFTAPFAFDDIGSIVENSAIRNLHNFTDTASFAQADIAGTLRPLLKTRYMGYLSFALNYAVHGLNVKGYHLVNILIHIINSLLVYLLLLLTFRTPSFCGATAAPAASPSSGSRTFVALFTALLFAVHPIQTQAVTYIVQRFASLAALFYLLSLVAYVRFRLADEARSFSGYTFYALALAATALAMKTKEFSLLLPLMIGLYEWAFFAGAIKKRILHLVPFALTSAIIPLSMMHVSAAKVSGALGDISRGDYLLTQFRVIMTYLRLLILPVGQNLDYDFPVCKTFFSAEVLPSFLALSALLAVALWLLRLSRHGKRQDSGWLLLAACGLLWFFVAMLPESSVIPIADVIFEHRMYLPSIGLFLAATVAAELLIARVSHRYVHARKTAVAVMAALVAVLSATAYARNAVWSDQLRLTEDIAKKSPAKARPQFNLGLVYWLQGRADEAIVAYANVIRIDPAYSAGVYNNLGVALMSRGRVDEAIRVYQAGMLIDRRDGDLHFNLARAYTGQGRIDEAVAEFKAALQRKPDDADVHFYLGTAYGSQGAIDLAIKEYTVVLGLRPNDEWVRNNLGTAYDLQGRRADAVNQYQAALKIKPDFVEAHYNLGNTLAKLGRTDEAKSEYKIALRLKPDFRAARQQLERLPGAAH